MTAVLDHVTVETGHIRSSPRSEVAAEVLVVLRSALAVAFETADPVLVGGGWTMVAMEIEDALTAALYPPGMAYPGPPGLMLWVRHRDGRPPLLESSITGMALGTPFDLRTAAMEAGDLGRCVAWAWLTLDE